MKAISNNYIQRLLLTLTLVMEVGVCGFGQTFTYVNENDIPNADGEPKWFEYGETGTTRKLQATHELKQTIYIASGETKTLYIQARHVQTYQRWFRYDEVGNLPAGFTVKTDVSTQVNLGTNGIYTTYANNNSAYVPPTVGYACVGATIAADLARGSTTSGNTVKEPVLSYRMIYKIEDASVIANALSQTSQNNPLERYDMMAPTGKQLLIGPKYTYTSENSGYQPNYYLPSGSSFVKTSARKSGNDNNTAFYWLCVSEAGAAAPTMSSTRTPQDGTPDNNSKIANLNIYNGRILAVTPQSAAGTIHNWYLLNESGPCIAHFRITYYDATEVGPYNNGSTDGNNEGIAGKDRESLKALYKPLVDKNFDFLDKNANNNYYRTQALPWAESSYGFFSSSSATAKIPEWSEYGFFKTFYNTDGNSAGSWSQQGVNDRTNARTNGSVEGRMYYIDAAQTTGTVSNLDISDACCPGTKLYISTWIHNMNNQNSLGPNLNFEIVGIEAGTNEESIFQSYTTGTMNTTSSTSGVDVWNKWNQVFFTVTVPRENYSKMYFRIINNQLGSSGNDFAIDDIDIYMMKPAVEAEIRAPMCGESAVSHIKVKHQKMLDIVGMTTSDTQNLPIGYCFVDKKIYDNYLLNGLDKNGNKIEASLQTEENAFNEAAVKIASTAAVGGSEYFSYFLLKPSITSYAAEPTIASNETIGAFNTRYADEMKGSPNKVFKSIINDEGNEVDGLSFQATLLSSDNMPIAPGREYYIIFNIQGSLINGDDISSVETTLVDPLLYTKTKLCDVYDTFELKGMAVISVNGQSSLYNGGTDMCSNTRPTFTVKHMIYMEGTEEKELATESIQIYFDWYNGMLQDFKATKYYPDGDNYKETDNGSTPFSVYQALNEFRKYYPAATDASRYVAAGTYTEPMRQLLIKLSTDATSGFESDHTLVLYKKGFSPLISGDLGTIHYYLAIPIEGTIDNSVSGATLICLEPQQLAITSSALAPSFGVGVDDIDYKKISNVPIRIGLPQIKEVTSDIKDPSITQSSRYLEIPIRTKSINFSDKVYTNIMNVASLNPRYQQVFLVGSDDTSDETAKAVDENMQVGYINWLDISTTVGENKLAIYFKIDDMGNLPITLREGYTYYLKFYFSEYLKSGTNWETANTCEGNVIIPLKIVPEYQVWVGGAGNRNWNNDANWRRAEKNDFYGPDDYKSNNDNYISGTTQKSFVPLEFTKVIFYNGDSNTAHLVNLAPKEESDNSLNMSIGEAEIGGATTEIEYDLVVDYKRELTDNYYPCTSFYANTCQEIYFKPGAALMNPHLMRYDKAHVDFTIDTKRWYLLGSPLQGVVAGDMYTLKSGVQNTHAFEDINYNTTDNNRFAPAVYQRGWDKVNATVYNFDNSNNAGDQTQSDVAVKAAWSSVYNDVKAPYLPGAGFSIKSVPSGDTQTENTFRLPKADTEYDYYTVGGQSDSPDKATIERGTSAGKLASDGLKSSAMVTATLATSNIGNADTANKLYLLANPFMTHLNMQKFFEVNTMFQSAYWLMTADKQVGVIMGEGAITSSDGLTSIAPMQGFFVRLKDGEVANPTVKYTAAMMTDPFDSGSGPLTRSAEGVEQLYITTTRDGISGTTSVRVADESAEESEMQNLPTLLDSNWDSYPLVYTIGSEGQAMQIQTVKSINTIPLGIHSNSAEPVEVRFDNAAAFEGLSLYDALLDESMPIEEGTILSLPGNTNGRYLLTFASSIEEDLTQSITISAVERGQIWVTSDINDPIEEIVVVDASGRVVHQQRGIGSNSATIAMPGDIYVVKVTTANTTQTGKVMVRN